MKRIIEDLTGSEKDRNYRFVADFCCLYKQMDKTCWLLQRTDEASVSREGNLYFNKKYYMLKVWAPGVFQNPMEPIFAGLSH